MAIGYEDVKKNKHTGNLWTKERRGFSSDITKYIPLCLSKQNFLNKCSVQGKKVQKSVGLK